MAASHAEAHGHALAALPEPLSSQLQAQQYDAQRRGFENMRPPPDYYVVWLGAEAAGRLVLQEEPESMRLIDVALLNRYRGRGVGTEVLRQLQTRAGGRPLNLQVLISNPARHLYLRLGFEVIGQSETRIEMCFRRAPFDAKLA